MIHCVEVVTTHRDDKRTVYRYVCVGFGAQIKKFREILNEFEVQMAGPIHYFVNDFDEIVDLNMCTYYDDVKIVEGAVDF